ncbi:BRCT domain protein [Aspergillus mulundensis]|uniref:Uncharacterized protein n=1 Tax=Aspergillus mulundensis TaxID=1810919 RepID=A0A3D8SVN2_9EURO|nr:hypothetical protein DSM5745_01623 [Aspergillus mulundensis]RDW89848.1 hypothetical protein DSM5745_01623 [Aspergillus mulundensis]
MGKTFQRIHASSVGSFGKDTTKIPRWITANGGTYSDDVVDGLTHLIASKDAYMRNAPAVAQAKELGTVKIVSYDWIAESLLSRTRSPRPAKEYLWVNILKGEKKKGSAKKVQGNKGQARQSKSATASKGQSEGDKTEENEAEESQKKKGASAKEKRAKLAAIKKKRMKTASGKSQDPFDTKRRTPKAISVASRYSFPIMCGLELELSVTPVDSHRLYEADDLTAYSATLVRPSGTIQGARHTVQLKIYETIKPPHKYATHIRLTRGFRGGPAQTDFLAPLGSDLDTAVTAFKFFFKERTGKDWEDRLSGIAPDPQKDEDGNVKPPHEGWWWYDNPPVSSLASLFRDGEI